VIAMQGIYAGLVDDATILTRALAADLWIVQRDTRGPFAEASRLDPSLESRAASVPGVARARAYTYQIIQRPIDGRQLRLAVVGLAWPAIVATIPLVARREVAHLTARSSSMLRSACRSVRASSSRASRIAWSA
jgi:putative ABC transport system permease protein